MNTEIGEYYTVYMAIRDHLHKFPPKKGDKTMINYLNEFGITYYPEIMRTISNVRFIDADLIYKTPVKL
jgi:hypothetical protein